MLGGSTRELHPGSFGADLTRQRRRRAVLEEKLLVGWLVAWVAPLLCR